MLSFILTFILANLIYDLIVSNRGNNPRVLLGKSKLLILFIAVFKTVIVIYLNSLNLLSFENIYSLIILLLIFLIY
jgi:hypothetical protein